MVCLRCRSTIIGAPYNYQLDYASASELSGSDSLSTGEREDLAEAPTETIPVENYEPGTGYHAGAEDNPYADDGGQGYDPDAPYEPGNGYRTDDEIREDEQPVGKLTAFLSGPFEELPRPLRSMFVDLAALIGFCVVIWFWADRKAEQEPSPQYDAPATAPVQSLEGTATPGAIDPAARSSVIIPASPAGNPGKWVLPGDYPTAALREERSGTVGFQLEISATGEVIACNISESSGQADLDEAACSALMRRARFNPAQDASGEPVRSSFINRVRWEIPQ